MIIILEMLVSRLGFSVFWCRCSVVASGTSPAVYIQAELTESHLELMGHNCRGTGTAPLARSGFTSWARPARTTVTTPVSLNTQADMLRTKNA